MAVDPFLVPLLETLEPLPVDIDFPAWRQDAVSAADAMVEQLSEPGPAATTRREISIDVVNGSIDLVVHTPAAAHPDKPLPVHLYFHGGGWIQGTAKQKYIDVVGQERAIGANSKTASRVEFERGAFRSSAAMGGLRPHPTGAVANRGLAVVQAPGVPDITRPDRTGSEVLTRRTLSQDMKTTKMTSQRAYRSP